MERVFGWSSEREPMPAAASRLDYLNLGCGNCFHGQWTNVDISPQDPSIIAHNLNEPLPFSDRQFSVVYHSHVLEHLSRHQGKIFLLECHRVLKPGGLLRVVVPDLESIARLYLKYLEGALAGDEEARQRYEWIILELLDQMVREQSGGEMRKYWRQDPMPAEDFVFERMGEEVRRVIQSLRKASPQERSADKASSTEVAGFAARGELHKWMYDRYSLAKLLGRSGFDDPHVCAAAESAIPNFAFYGLDTTGDGSVRKPDSLFMEATKPP